MNLELVFLYGFIGGKTCCLHDCLHHRKCLGHTLSKFLFVMWYPWSLAKISLYILKAKKVTVFFSFREASKFACGCFWRNATNLHNLRFILVTMINLIIIYKNKFNNYLQILKVVRFQMFRWMLHLLHGDPFSLKQKC